MVWYSHLFQNFPQFIVIHTVKGFGIVNKAEIDIFLELSCFFHDPADVGNLISGSSAFSKTSLIIRKFTVHILLKPGLENFEHYFTSVSNRPVLFNGWENSDPEKLSNTLRVTYVSSSQNCSWNGILSILHCTWTFCFFWLSHTTRGILVP